MVLLLLLLILAFAGVCGDFLTVTVIFCFGLDVNGDGKSADADCCGVGGFLCKNWWLKKTSNGIRSLAFRRNKPNKRFWSSTEVQGGIL